MIYLSMSSPLHSPSPLRDIYELISPDSLYVLYLLFCFVCCYYYCIVCYYSLLTVFICYVICLFLFCIPLLLSRVFTTCSAIAVVLVSLYFFSFFIFSFFFILTLLSLFTVFLLGLASHYSIQLLVACNHIHLIH